MRLAVEQQTGDVLRVPVEVDQDRLISREEAVERVLGQGMRVLSALPEDEQVVDVDNSHSEPLVLEDGRRGDDLEGDLDTAADKNNVRILAAVGRESLPDGSTGDTVSLGLVNVQPAANEQAPIEPAQHDLRDGRVLRTNDKVDVWS